MGINVEQKTVTQTQFVCEIMQVDEYAKGKPTGNKVERFVIGTVSPNGWIMGHKFKPETLTPEILKYMVAQLNKQLNKISSK